MKSLRMILTLSSSKCSQKLFLFNTISSQNLSLFSLSSAMSVSFATMRHQLLCTHNVRVRFLRLASSPRLLSTTMTMRATEKEKEPRKQPQASQPQNTGNPEYPAFSLDSLGLSKNMKIVVLVLISIFGTIETWFYCQAIWRWWKGRQESEQA